MPTACSRITGTTSRCFDVPPPNEVRGNEAYRDTCRRSSSDCGGAPCGDIGKGAAFLADGRVVLVGDTNSFGFIASDDAFVLLVSPRGRGLDSNTWGGVSLDHADDVAVAPAGTIVMAGTTLNAPPYAFQRAARRLSRLQGTTETPSQAFSDAAFTVADPAGTVATPDGSTTFSGEDAALIRIAP
jgi:hypothetical protein